MAEIYILSDYGKLTKKDETIVFVQPDGTRTILFPFKTEQLVVMGNVLGGGIVAVIGQKQKNRLREEAKRAQRNEERAINAGEILLEEYNKRK